MMKRNEALAARQSNKVYEAAVFNIITASRAMVLGTNDPRFYLACDIAYGIIPLALPNYYVGL